MAELTNTVAGACPTLESIAAYLDGRLTDRERADVTEHLASCEDCYVLFSESAQIHATEGAVSKGAAGWRGGFAGSRFAWSTAGAALATAAAVVLMIGTGGLTRWRQGNAELQALVAAVGTDRPIEARLTGGFAYGPMRGSVRSGAPLAQMLSPDLRLAAASIEKTLAAHPTADSLHVFGVASLIAGDIDRAITLLEQAADQSSPDARTVSDLSAAYLARAARDNSQQDLMKALSAADRAVQADDRLAEAWFNRADALEGLSLVAEARDAWRDYLKVDGQSGWATEARRRLERLDSKGR